MIRDVLQCCYSNVTSADGGSATDGWKPLAISPGMPDSAYQNCVRMQSGRSEITRFGDCRDESGNVLNLMELIGEEGYLYFIRTQFGLKERAHGREINFSHALIFPYADREQICDPNSFLRVSNENFKYTPEEASADQGELLLEEKFVLREALTRCGIDAGEYCLLMECIYQKMTDWTVKEPLYVRYDGTEEHMRALLYCIYMGLPYGLRREFSAGPVPADVMPGKNVVFTLHTEGRNAYIDPETGENNVLDENLETLIRELGFVTWVPEHFEDPDFDIDCYYSRLEDQAVSFGDYSASDERILKIAHMKMQSAPIEELGEEELLLRLHDALSSPSGGNEAMDGLIATLMDEIRNRNGWMGERNEKILEKRLRVTHSDALKTAAEAWQYYSFSGRLSEDEMAEQLKKMTPEKYKEYSERLKTSETGLAALDKYYLSRLRDKPDPDMEFLQNFIGELLEFDLFWSLPETRKEIERLAKEKYLKELDRGIKLTPPRLVENYNALINLLGGLHSKEELEPYKERARSEIWKRVGFANIDFRAQDQYMSSDIAMSGDDRCLMYREYIQLPGVLKCALDEPEFIRKYRKFFDKHHLSLQSDEGKAAHEAMMKCLEDRKLYSDESFKEWCRKALNLPENALECLLAVFHAWKETDTVAMAEGLQQLTEESQEREISEDALKSLADFLLKLCIVMDSKSSTISLDTWLTIAGLSNLKNSFDFLDLFYKKRNGSCYFLKDEKYDILSSKRFREKRFRQEAEEYVARNGREGEKVKRWLSEARKQEKKEEAQARKNKKQDKKKGAKVKTRPVPEEEEGYEVPNPEEEEGYEVPSLEEEEGYEVPSLEEEEGYEVPSLEEDEEYKVPNLEEDEEYKVPNLEEEISPKHPENEVDTGRISFYEDKDPAGEQKYRRTEDRQGESYRAPWNSAGSAKTGGERYPEAVEYAHDDSEWHSESFKYGKDSSVFQLSDDEPESDSTGRPDLTRQSNAERSSKRGRKDKGKGSGGSFFDRFKRGGNRED